MRKQTLLLHGAYKPYLNHGVTTLPIFQSSSFAYESAEEIEKVFEGKAPGFVYSRINNPGIQNFEQKMTILEDGLASIATASGMSAISIAILGLLEKDDEIISGNSIFGGTYSLFNNTLTRYGIKTNFVESTNPDAFKNEINNKTKAIFVETIGNPKLDVPDIKAISKIAKDNNIVLIVDNTVTTPMLCQPKKLGGDIIIHSTSKFINGHGNSIGGIIIDAGTFNWNNPKYKGIFEYYKKTGDFAFISFLRNRIFRDFGACPSPFNIFLNSIGIESLGVRLEKHCKNALEIAEYFEKDKRIKNVSYPGLKTHKNHEIADIQFGNSYGAILTMELESKEKCFKFINNLKLAQNLANLGDVKTLVIHPASTFCKDANEYDRKKMGVTEELIRFSIGIEDVNDIIDDINNALDKLYS